MGSELHLNGSRAVLVLGRDGLGADADEADFEAWVDYVSTRIDEASGCDVTIEIRGARDVQDDDIRAIDDVREDGYPTREAVDEAKHRLWDEMCADATAWPVRS